MAAEARKACCDCKWRAWCDEDVVSNRSREVERRDKLRVVGSERGVRHRGDSERGELVLRALQNELTDNIWIGNLHGALEGNVRGVGLDWLAIADGCRVERA